MKCSRVFFLSASCLSSGERGRGVLLHVYKIHSVLGHYCCMYIYHKSIDFKSVQHHSSKQMSLVPPVTSIKHLNPNNMTKKISRENLLKFLKDDLYSESKKNSTDENEKQIVVICRSMFVVLFFVFK